MAVGAMSAAGLVSCRTSKTVEPTVTFEPQPAQLPVIGNEATTVPMAIVYQTSGDNAMDLVPITLSADGKSIVSYPAPGDLNDGQTPINLGDGWWLDRRGLSAHSVFTTYTYEEYEAMQHAPALQELMNHIDRNVRITRMVELPITAAEAEADPAVVRAYTEGGFPDCKEIPLP